MADGLKRRRKRGLTQAKAKIIAKEGLSSAGDGFHSPAQKGYVGLIAGGGTPTRMKSNPHGKRRMRGRSKAKAAY